MIRRLAIRPLLTSLVTLAVLAGGVAVALAVGTGAVPGKDASAVQYLSKPGCGPDKTDGVAGNSGQHTGQPPKRPARQDCPNPRGQNK